LTPIIWSIGHWAAEWIFGDPADEDCDGLSIMWRLHKQAIGAKLPQRRTIVHLVLTGVGAAEGWLKIERGAISVCKDDPGYDVDLTIEADTRQMQRWLVGLVPFRQLTINDHARMVGPSRLTRAFPAWFDNSYFADSLRRGEQRRRREAPSAWPGRQDDHPLTWMAERPGQAQPPVNAEAVVEPAARQT
jgi:hypothetical protein